MQPKNTANLIPTGTENNKQIKPKTPASIMGTILNAQSTKKLLQNTLKENAGAFSASVLDLYNTDRTLQECDPRAVFGECLKAASLKLPINKQLGFAYVIPYKGKPQFQIGYKGLIQLALRTRAYKYINADVVYEGEFKGSDKLTGQIDISGEAKSDTVVGYFAYIETIDGFKKALYWDKEKVTAHAKKFSKSYSSPNSVWTSNFDAMAIKTVLRNLLTKSGCMSIEMTNAFEAEDNAGRAAEVMRETTDAEDSLNIDDKVIQTDAIVKDVTEDDAGKDNAAEETAEQTGDGAEDDPYPFD